MTTPDFGPLLWIYQTANILPLAIKHLDVSGSSAP
jgi:hypothetical protein